MLIVLQLLFGGASALIYSKNRVLRGAVKLIPPEYEIEELKKALSRGGMTDLRFRHRLLNASFPPR